MRAPRTNYARRKEHNRNQLVVALLALLTLAGCATGTPPPSCVGTVRQLNPDRWQAAPNDLVAPPAAQAASAPGTCRRHLLVAVAGGGIGS